MEDPKSYQNDVYLRNYQPDMGKTGLISNEAALNLGAVYPADIPASMAIALGITRPLLASELRLPYGYVPASDRSTGKYAEKRRRDENAIAARRKANKAARKARRA